MDKIPADIYVKNYLTLRAIAKDHQVLEERKEQKKCLWYTGLPGTGKTRKAREDNPGAYYKLQNKWWDGYQGQKTVIMDDLGLDNGKFLVTHMKLWCDPW